MSGPDLAAELRAAAASARLTAYEACDVVLADPDLLDRAAAALEAERSALEEARAALRPFANVAEYRVIRESFLQSVRPHERGALADALAAARRICAAPLPPATAAKGGAA